MNDAERSQLLEFFYNTRPLGLLAGMLLYALGAGIVAYSGTAIDWRVYWLGQACVSLLQMSSAYLLVYFDRLQSPRRRMERNSNHQDPEEQARTARNLYLLAAFTTLLISAMLIVLLLRQRSLPPGALVILGVAFLFAYFYAVPPLRLAYSGYGELVAAVLLTNLIPGFAYLLQEGDMIRILGILTLPLTILYLALTLATSLEHYYEQIKSGKQNLMTRLGWQRGMSLHNLCILISYLTIGMGALFGLPWTLTWPRLLTFPIGIFQAWQIWQIGNGAKPRWRLLRITAYATFAITAYLLVFTLWVK